MTNSNSTIKTNNFLNYFYPIALTFISIGVTFIIGNVVSINERMNHMNVQGASQEQTVVQHEWKLNDHELRLRTVEKHDVEIKEWTNNNFVRKPE